MPRLSKLSVLVLLFSTAPVFAAIDPDLLAGLKARNIGPAGMSGRITDIVAVESDPDVVYVGAATGGLWKSVSGAVTWKPIFDDQPVHAIGAVAVFQPNPSIVWVGTGEGNVRNSASVGEGVFKSLDAGKTWQRVGLEKSERIARIVLHPTNPEVAWVCVTGQEWGENPDRGVFKTEDGGKSWKKTLFVNDKTGCGQIALDPRNAEHLIAALWQFRRDPYQFKSGGPGSGIYASYDGGATWKREQEEDGLPKGNLGRSAVAFSPSSPEIVYALVEAKKSALLRSEDGGRSWKTVNDQPNVSPRPFYFSNLRIDPAASNRIYRLGYGISVSDDGGKSFRRLEGTRGIHGDYHAMWIDPRDGRHMLTGDDGGIAESRDRGKSFRFVSNLPVGQWYHVQLDQETPYNVYGGLQDNGSWRGPSSVWQTGGITNHLWQMVGGGDGFETIPDPRDPSQGYSESQGGDLTRWNLKTGELKGLKPPPPEGVKLRFNWNAGLALDPFDPNTVYLGSQFLHKSTDRGESWTLLSPDLTTNKPEWQKADESGGLTIDASRAENFETILSIAPSAVEKGLIWVGTDDGRVHITRDGGSSWTSLETNIHGVPPATWTPHIKASRFAGGTAFIVFDNHRREDWKPYVFRTDDYGKTWVNLATADLRGYALAIEEDTVKKDLLFLGTEFGLYFSPDGGKSWSHLKKTLPTASVMDLAVHPRENDLVIATHGRAVWVLDDIRPLRALSEQTMAEPVHLFEIASAQQHWNRPPEASFGLGATEFRGENRDYGAILTYSLNLPGLQLQDEEKERARKEKEREDQRAREEAKSIAGGEEKSSGAAGKVKVAATEAAGEKGKENEPEKEKDKEKAAKVDIEVTDAAGKLVRKFQAPAKLGVNRAVWDLNRDPWKELPRDESAQRGSDDDDRTGPEVAPGSYTVTVKYEGHEAKQTLQVGPDPRSRNGAAEWQAREGAISELESVFNTTVDAVWRIRLTRDDAALVAQRVRQAAKDAGEKDEKKLGELPLVKSADKLKEGLTDLEKRLWQSPETIGIQAGNDVLTKIYESTGALDTWDPPTVTHRESMRQARAKLAAFLADLNKFFDADVAAFREQAEEAKVSLLPAAAPLALQ